MRTPTRKDRDPLISGRFSDDRWDEISPEESSQRDAAQEAGGVAAAAADEHGFVRPPEREQALPMVAIVGRPNVGKSTLFNRIIGRRKAVVHDRPGVTRDRNIDRAEWDGISFLCVDTGGYDIELDDPLLENVVEQARLAIEEADVIVVLLAVGEEAHPADLEIIERLRGVDKPIYYAVNKADSPALELAANDYYRYGIETLYPLSALHGVGIADLMKAILGALRGLGGEPTHVHASGGIALAVVGRQNVGKSTLINRLCGEERVIASDVPGTTRDSIDTFVRTPAGTLFRLIDTAGIRRRGKIERGIEKLSVFSSLISLERADVAAIVIDAEQGLTEQDAHIAGYCLDAGLPTMILVNKWDLVAKDGRTADQFTKKLEEEWAFLRYAPVLYLSAKTGQRAQRVFEIAERIYTNSVRRIPTHDLNERLEAWVQRQPPAMARNRRPKIRFWTQTGIKPPTFTLFVNDPTLFHFSYKRYLVNRLRETYDFEGTPIKIQLRQNKVKAGDPKIKEE